MNAQAKAILEYWLGDLEHTPEYFQARMRRWFMGGRAVDEEIRGRFLNQVELAGKNGLEDWKSSPREALALVILLDQLSLNFYRDEARGYELSERAIPVAKQILKNGWDFALTPAEKIFLYMPLEHSESLADQEECVAHFTKLTKEACPELKGVMQGSLDYAKRHLAVVKRFGRFPHRNKALGRESRPEEIEFLSSKEAPF